MSAGSGPAAPRAGRAVTPLAVLTTVGSPDEARRIAREVVARKLAACAQLSTIETPGHESPVGETPRASKTLVGRAPPGALALNTSHTAAVSAS
jgi:hypothetical protein